MKTKNKSFLEDTFILFIIGIIIYAIYSFFFSSNENENEKRDEPIIIEKKTQNSLADKNIENSIKDIETFDHEETILNEKTILNEESIVEEEKIKIDEENLEDKDLLEDSIPTSNEEDKLNSDQEKKTEVVISEKKDDLDSFYQNIKDDIYINIKKNPLKNDEVLSIRLTILKNGNYQQLTLLNGNKKHFNQVKDSILKVFPLKIDENLKEKFPRYFRMKIENK